jgi:hypothetical protein
MGGSVAGLGEIVPAISAMVARYSAGTTLVDEK